MMWVIYVQRRPTIQKGACIKTLGSSPEILQGDLCCNSSPITLVNIFLAKVVVSSLGDHIVVPIIVAAILER